MASIVPGPNTRVAAGFLAHPVRRTQFLRYRRFPANGAFIESLCVPRPCSGVRLGQALFTLLRMGNVALYSSGNLPPLVVAAEAATTHLPPGMIESLGRPVCVHSAQEIKQAVESG